MKRLYISIAIIIVCLAFAVWSSISVTDKLNKMLSALQNDAISAVELWQKEKNFISGILCNEVTKDVSNEIYKLKRAIENNDDEEIKNSSATIEDCIKTILDRDKITFGNIL